MIFIIKMKIGLIINGGNLEHLTRSCHAKTKNLQSNNTSGIVGVSWKTGESKWVAQITLDNKNKYLGIFKDKDDAVKTRWEAERKYNFSDCQTTSSAYNYLKEKGLINGKEVYFNN